jgi:hypothetical protein
MPRTARTMIANDRGPSGRPARYPARAFRSISARSLADSAVSRWAILVGPVASVTSLIAAVSDELDVKIFAAAIAFASGLTTLV